MAFDIKHWNKVVCSDLGHRMFNFDKDWKQNEKYVRNVEEGKLYGNLVRDFERVIFNRVINRAGVIKVYADDTNYADQADSLAVVANALSRIVSFKENLRQATFISTYSMGWMWVGHPFASFGLDPRRYFPAQENVRDTSSAQSVYEPVDEASVANRGVDLSQISVADFDVEELTETQPEPVFTDGGIGMPYCEFVDGKHVVTQKNVHSYEDSCYVGRLRLYTKSELEMLMDENSDIDFETLDSCSKKYIHLFPDYDSSLMGEAYLFVELWVKRDRKNLKYNNWSACFALEQESQILREGPNPWGGMIPGTPVRVNRMGRFLDETFVDDMTRLSEMYSITIQSVEADIKESLNTKIITDARAQIENNEAKKLTNPSYKGRVDVGGQKDGIEIYRGKGLDVNKINYIRFLRDLAQSTSNTSDIDRGQPIKKITARQTSALQSASQEVMDGIRELVAEAGAEVIYKLLHILHVFHGEKKQFEFGGARVHFDPGTTDFTSSAIYRISVTDMGPEASAEEAMLMMNSLRSIAGIEELRQRMNWDKLSEVFTEKMRWPKDTVAPLKQPQGPDPLSMLPGASQGGSGALFEGGFDGRPPGTQADSEEAPDLGALLSGLNI